MEVGELQCIRNAEVSTCAYAGIAFSITTSCAGETI